jgi:hypothetical protein
MTNTKKYGIFLVILALKIVRLTNRPKFVRLIALPVREMAIFLSSCAKASEEKYALKFWIVRRLFALQSFSLVVRP